jgi:cysteine desulfurase / selenocysteine lyase
VRPIDVDAARAATPGAEHVVHLNNAGAALPPEVVLDAQVSHLRREATIGGYEAAAEAEADGRLDRTYEAIAELIGCRRLRGGGGGLRHQGLGPRRVLAAARPGDRVLTTRAEYGANAIALLHLADRTGCRIDLVDDDEHGQVDLDALDRELARGGVAFVSLVHVPTQSGLVNPAAEVGRRCRDAGVPLVLDACQSAGQLPLDVDELGCDVLTATGRKFLRGPRGTGFGYVRTSLLERLDPVTLDLRAATWVAPDRYELAPGRAASRPGSAASPATSAWAWPWTTRWAGASTPSRRGTPSWPTGSAAAWPPSMASPCGTAAGSSAPS